MIVDRVAQVICFALGALLLVAVASPRVGMLIEFLLMHPLTYASTDIESYGLGASAMFFALGVAFRALAVWRERGR